MCFSTRNRILVLMDWAKVKVFGRDVSRSDTNFYLSISPPPDRASNILFVPYRE